VDADDRRAITLLADEAPHASRVEAPTRGGVGVDHLGDVGLHRPRIITQASLAASARRAPRALPR
jgi:hypothetical protein